MNCKSRRGAEWFAQARERLSSGGLELVEARAFANPDELPAAVERHIRAEVPLVIAGGGDGTLSAVVHLFARQETVLGVLPLGTGNAFARDLSIPAELDEACDTILHGKVAEIDMGLIANREFVNVATIGLSTQIALGLQDDLKRKFGRAVYFVSLLKALASVRAFRVELELPGGRHEFSSLQLVIGNGRFHAGPFPVAPDASITGGWLSIYALASTRKIDFLRMALHMRGGKQVHLAEVKGFRARSGKLQAWPKQRITIDGETKELTPVEFGIVPRALKVAVPVDFQERTQGWQEQEPDNA